MHMLFDRHKDCIDDLHFYNHRQQLCAIFSTELAEQFDVPIASNCLCGVVVCILDSPEIESAATIPVLAVVLKPLHHRDHPISTCSSYGPTYNISEVICK